MKRIILFFIAALTTSAPAFASTLTCWVPAELPSETRSIDDVKKSGWSLVKRDGTTYRLTLDNFDFRHQTVLEVPNLRLDFTGTRIGVVISDGNSLIFQDSNVSIYCDRK